MVQQQVSYSQGVPTSPWVSASTGREAACLQCEDVVQRCDAEPLCEPLNSGQEVSVGRQHRDVVPPRCAAGDHSHLRVYGQLRGCVTHSLKH